MKRIFKIITPILLVLLLVLTFFVGVNFQIKPKEANAATCSKRFLAYYPYWNEFDGTSWFAYKSDKIPFSKLTHIIHAFVTINSNGTISAASGFLEPLLISRAHANGVKVLVSIGGAGETTFSTVAASSSYRTTFVNAIESFLRTNGYDGVDIDWEFPENATDKANFNLLVQQLRSKFNSSASPAPTWLISAALANSNYGGQWYDLATLNQYVDFYNIMTYDYYGTWASRSGHNSPLYRGTDPGTSSNWAASFSYYTSTRGVPASKLNFGIPFFGYKIANSENLYDNCGGDCATGSKGLNYSGIVPLIGNGWTSYLDSGSKVPYLRYNSGTGFITYDDPTSVRLKVDFAFSNNLGGIFMYHLFQDYKNGSQPLLDAMYSEYSTLCGGSNPPPSDTTAPTVSITSPANGSSHHVSSPVTISATASDNVSVSSVKFYAGTTLLCTDTASPYSCSYTTPSSAQSVTLKATATDSSGNTKSSTVTISVTAGTDTTKPSITITYPTNGATIEVSKTITITASATDNVSVSSVKFYAGTTLLCTDTTSPHSCSYTTPSTAQSITLKATATDSSNNTADSTSTISVTAAPDTTKPTVSMTYPTSGSNIEINKTITLTATASDNTSVSSVKFYAGTSFVGTDTSSPYSYVYTTPSTTQSMIFKAIATDSSGNTQTHSVTANIVLPPDTTAPTVSITNPTYGQSFDTNEPVTISATASDNRGVASVKFYAAGALKCTDTSSPYSCAYTTPSMAQSIALRAVATDTSNNIADKEVIIIVTSTTPPTTDTTAPTVSITYPANAQVVKAKSDIVLKASATDNVGMKNVKFYVDNALKCTDTISPYSCTWRSYAYSRNVTVKAVATDTSNNSASTQISVRVRRAKTPKPIVIESPDGTKVVISSPFTTPPDVTTGALGVFYDPFAQLVSEDIELPEDTTQEKTETQKLLEDFFLLFVPAENLDGTTLGVFVAKASYVIDESSDSMTDILSLYGFWILIPLGLIITLLGISKIMIQKRLKARNSHFVQSGA